MNLKCCLSVAYCNVDMILPRHATFFISVSISESWSIYVLFMWSAFSLSFLFLLQLINFCLVFCQFQPGVAYKSVAHKKKCVSSNRDWKKCTLMLILTFKTAENLCPNFRKPLLPSKIPGYAPVVIVISKLESILGRKLDYFWDRLFKKAFLILQTFLMENPLSHINSCFFTTQLTTSDFSVILEFDVDPGYISLNNINSAIKPRLSQYQCFL